MPSLKSTRSFVVLILSPLISFSQANTECKDLKNGQFYFYSQSSPAKYLYIRSDEVQKEIDVETGDTTYWEIEWLNDCTYSIRYKGGGKHPAAYFAMFRKHKGVVVISNVTAAYYIYTMYLDKVSDVIMGSDTIWRKEKKVADRTFKDNDFIEAAFPGGDKGWANYIREVITDNLKPLTRSGKSGTCYVTFIVDTDGSITNVEALTMEDSRLAKVATKAIIEGPKWKPARMKGKPVKAFRIQPVTFKIIDE